MFSHIDEADGRQSVEIMGGATHALLRDWSPQRNLGISLNDAPPPATPTASSTIDGTDDPDTLNGSVGDDTVYGRAGADNLFGDPVIGVTDVAGWQIRRETVTDAAGNVTGRFLNFTGVNQGLGASAQSDVIFAGAGEGDDTNFLAASNEERFRCVA